MRSRSSTSFIVLLTLQITVCIVLFLLSGQPAEASMREWPVPPVPPGVVDGNPPSDAGSYLEPWQDYLIYLGLVLVIPFLYAVVFALITLCACIFCRPCAVTCCGSACTRIREKPLSVGKRRVLSLIPYSIVYAIVLICTGLGIAFFLWFLIGWINVRSETYSTISTASKLPDSVVSSTRDIVSVVPDIVDDFESVVTEVSDFDSEIRMVSKIVNDTKEDIDGVKPYLDQNNVHFNNIVTIQQRMANRTEEASQEDDFGKGFEPVDASQFQDAFKDADSAISSSVNDGFDEFETAIDEGLQGVNEAVSNIQSQISTFNDTIRDQLNTVTSRVEELMTQGKDTYQDYVNDQALKDYEMYTKIAEAVFGVVVILILCTLMAFMTLGVCCVCVHFAPCVQCFSCCAYTCSCCCMLIYGIVGAFCLFLFFLTSDICDQGESYIGKVETSLELPTFEIPNPTGGSVNVTFSESALGVLNCESNFLNASGLSLEAFGIPDYIRGYEDKLTEALSRFNVDDFLGESLDGLSTITNNINIAEDISSQVDQLKVQTTNAINNFFSSALILSIEDFEREQEYFAELNQILDDNGMTTLDTVDEIFTLAPGYYVKSDDPSDATNVRFPGKINETGPGASFSTYEAGISGVEDRDRLWGNLAYTNGTPPTRVVPTGSNGTDALVYKLSRMAVGYPAYPNATYQDYVEMNKEFDLLVQSVNETEQYIEEIFDLEPKVDNILSTFNQTYNDAVTTIKTFVFAAIDRVFDRVENTDVLQCKFIGDYYRTVKSSFCNNLRISLCGTAVISLLMVSVLLLAYAVIMEADCLTFCKGRETYSKDYDSDSPFGEVDQTWQK